MLRIPFDQLVYVGEEFEKAITDGLESADSETRTLAVSFLLAIELRLRAPVRDGINDERENFWRKKRDEVLTRFRSEALDIARGRRGMWIPALNAGLLSADEYVALFAKDGKSLVLNPLFESSIFEPYTVWLAPPVFSVMRLALHPEVDQDVASPARKLQQLVLRTMESGTPTPWLHHPRRTAVFPSFRHMQLQWLSKARIRAVLDGDPPSDAEKVFLVLFCICVELENRARRTKNFNDVPLGVLVDARSGNAPARAQIAGSSMPEVVRRWAQGAAHFISAERGRGKVEPE